MNDGFGGGGRGTPAPRPKLGGYSYTTGTTNVKKYLEKISEVWLGKLMDVFPKIVSLIPSATEIVASLQRTEWLVGRSHECDYPAVVRSLPVCTAPKFDPDGTSSQIHDRVTQILSSALSVYRVEIDLLEHLQPTHILTQAQCEVCAVSLADVEQAVATLTNSHPQVISLQPLVLADLWADIRRVAAALSVLGQTMESVAEQTIAALQARIAACTRQVQTLAARPTVACIEWTEPLMAAGNWVPELVTLAGGNCLFGTIGEHSPWLQPEAILAADPDVMIVMPCGFDLARTIQETTVLLQRPNWQRLTAVRQGRVYATDGNQYFNRPGPRLVDSLEILLEILHADRVTPRYQGTGWQSVQLQ